MSYIKKNNIGKFSGAALVLFIVMLTQNVETGFFSKNLNKINKEFEKMVIGVNKKFDKNNENVN